MAGTIVVGSFADGSVQFEADYDDNLDVLTFRCRNESDHKAFGLIQRVNDAGMPDGVQYGLEAPAGEITTIALPQGSSQGIRLSAGNKPGKFNGYSCDMRYPF